MIPESSDSDRGMVVARALDIDDTSGCGLSPRDSLALDSVINKHMHSFRYMRDSVESSEMGVCTVPNYDGGVTPSADHVG